MINFEFQASVKAVKVKVSEVDDLIVRTCGMRFECEFDDGIAAVLGKEAQATLAAMRERTSPDRGTSKVEIKIGDINATGEMCSDTAPDEPVMIPQLRGVKAVCKANKEATEPPTIEFDFTAMWSESVWVFLGKYAGAWVRVNLNDRQLSMELPTPGEVAEADA